MYLNQNKTEKLFWITLVQMNWGMDISSRENHVCEVVSIVRAGPAVDYLKKKKLDLKPERKNLLV
jgi:hypothetical protein